MSTDQAEHAHDMRQRIAVSHHAQHLEAVLMRYGTVCRGGLRMWNDKCDEEFAKLGHPRLDFLNCTCCENKDITG